jgi:hypothetical protein
MLVKENKIFLFSILAMVACIGYATYWHRPMFADGGLFLFDILVNQIASNQLPHIRLTGILFQAPVIALVKVGLIYPAIIFYSIFYLSIPLYLLIFLVKNKNIKNLYLFLIYTWLILFNGIGFPVNFANESAISGIILFLLTSKDSLNKRSYFSIFFFCLILDISYETGVFLFIPILLNIYLLRKSYTKGYYKKILMIVAPAFIIKVILNAYTTIYLSHTPVMDNFKDAIIQSLKIECSPFLYCFLIFLGSLLFINEKVRASIWVAAIAVYAYFTFSVPSNFYIVNSSDFRGLIVPSTFLFLCAVILYNKFKITVRVDRKLKLFLVIVCLIATSKDLRMTQSWSTGISNIEKTIQTTKDQCVSIPNNDTEVGKYFKYGMSTDAIAHTSIMLQSRSKIKTILLPTGNLDSRFTGMDYCKNFHNHHSMYITHHRNGYFPNILALSKFIEKDQLIERPKRYQFKFSELSNCSTVDIINIGTPAEDVISTNDQRDGLYIFKLLVNENPDISVKVDILINGHFKRQETIPHSEGQFELELKKGDKVNIKLAEEIWFEDIYHMNSNYYALKCVSLKKTP